jgi:hypothetical protein
MLFSFGSGHKRHPVISRTARTQLQPRDRIAKLLDIVLELRNANQFDDEIVDDDVDNDERQNEQDNRRRRRQQHRPSLKKKHHSESGARTVGGDVVPIAAHNVGHQLLRRMGWTGVGGLGKSGDGIGDPIVAIYKNDKRGLGF